MTRPPAIHHCTPYPTRFFGRAAELELLDRALAGDEPSVVAMIGPGGQGKTAIVQHWLSSKVEDSLRASVSGNKPSTFFWSFYRGKDSDLCLRELLAYAEGLDSPPDVSASWCVDRLLKILPHERWALILDGTEVVQHEQGGWFGRFVHPELGRLLEELASMPIPGVVVLTTRFPLPTLEHRKHIRILSLSTLDEPSAVALLQSLGVATADDVLAESARACGLHAKAVELLGTFLTRYRGGNGQAYHELSDASLFGAAPEEVHVSRVLLLLQSAMSAELQDILALATSFRQPPTEARLFEYLKSEPLRHLLHETWSRDYAPLQSRGDDWLRAQVQTLVDLRLLERVHLGRSDASRSAGGSPARHAGAGEPPALRTVLDAHPLVRRGFEHRLGGAGHVARSRAGFLRGRPDRRPPASLEDTREEVELFHAYAEAGLWNEADSTFVALDNPKHRFLAPAFERDLLLCFFPGGDWRQQPSWPGFGRYRSLAICLEMLGQFEDAIDVYRPADTALRGDALIALGRLQPFVEEPQAAHPWQTLWQAYRAHAFALLGRKDEALRIAQSIVPTDVYEWVHVFECLLRLGRLDALDLSSVLYRPPLENEHRWSRLARERMRLDYIRLFPTPSGREAGGESVDLGKSYRELIDAYDQGGLPFERVLTRLGYARLLMAQENQSEAAAVRSVALDLCRRFGMQRLAQDCESNGRP